jgi:uncharacterized protein YecT (DUF1311 family)
MKLFLSLLLLTLSKVAHADAPCLDIDPSQDVDGSSCEAQEVKHADADLNAEYKTLLVQLDSESKDNPDAKNAKAKLIESQRQWIKFRDADCDAVFTYNATGTIRVHEELQCELSHTKQRTEELKHLFDGT